MKRLTTFKFLGSLLKQLFN